MELKIVTSPALFLKKLIQRTIVQKIRTALFQPGFFQRHKRSYLLFKMAAQQLGLQLHAPHQGEQIWVAQRLMK